MRNPAAAVVLAVVLAGCGGTGGPGPQAGMRGSPAPAADAPPALPDRVTARYRCANGTQFVADFDNRAATVTLRTAEATLGVLAQQPAASGIWYAGNGTTLRGKGRDATLERPGRAPTQCAAEE